ncbi:MAG: hypothetical protein ACRC7N_05145 [Clostridium sp.]
MNYRRFRGYVPSNVVDEMEVKTKNGDKRGIIGLVLISIFLIPQAFDGIFRKEIEEVAVHKDENIDLKKKLIDDLSFGEISTSFEASDKKIKLEVEGYSSIKNIEKKDGINITTIKNNGNNKFIIEMSRR